MPICQKCSSDFPWRMEINGVMKNLQNRKFCIECSPYGAHNTRDLCRDPVPEEKFCPKCEQTLANNEFYIIKRSSGQYRLSSYCKLCQNNDRINRSRRWKERCVQYKGGACLICGYNHCVSAMDFHHIDPNEKDIDVSSMKSSSFESVRAELDKCVLLCCRCHREVHAGVTSLSG